MEHHAETYTTETKNGVPNAAVNGLAIIGFLALLVFGIMLAIYAVRYLPGVVSRLSQNHASTTPSLTVVPGNAQNGSVPLYSYRPTVASTTTVGPSHVPPASYSYPSAPTAAHTSTYQAPRHYGLPDLAVQGVVTGYLANGSNDSFVPAQVIPAGARAAVQFSVANHGGSATGPWSFVAELPTANGYVFTSPTEQSLNPGDHILFTLGFDQANPMPGPQVVTVVADPNDQITESDETNNSQSVAFQIAY